MFFFHLYYVFSLGSMLLNKIKRKNFYRSTHIFYDGKKNTKFGEMKKEVTRVFDEIEGCKVKLILPIEYITNV